MPSVDAKSPACEYSHSKFLWEGEGPQREGEKLEWTRLVFHGVRGQFVKLPLSPCQVQLLFDNEVLPDHMTMKQIWLSRWFGKVSQVQGSTRAGVG